MIYHFVKYVGIDIEANSLDEARKYLKIAGRRVDNDIDDYAFEAYDGEGCGIDIDATIENVHSGDAEYVGYTDDEDDPEERLYDYLTEDEDEDDDDVNYVLTDKGRDYFAYLRGEYPNYNESDYDEDGNKITPSFDGFVKILISLL